MSEPGFALVVARPLVWLLVRGIVRDLTVEADPTALLGHLVALQVAQHGDHQGYRRLAHQLAGTAFEGFSVAQVRAESPKGHLVGLAQLAKVVPVAGGWRVHLEQARPVAPVLVATQTVELVALPRGTRAALRVQVGLREAGR